MYVRFVTPLRDPATGAETGFFRAAWYLGEVGCPDWIDHELEAQFDWFNANLAIPRSVRGGVCWFRPDARECIERARYCAWLFGEGGVPVEAIRLQRPAQVLWRDDHQLVVRPDGETPRAFAGRSCRGRFRPD